MIFTKFLKKKWQHKDSTVRVEAINNSLSLDDPEQREIIEQLARSDDNENVRRAALIKLADFQSWLLHSQENSMAKIRQYADKKITAILTDQDPIKLSEQDKLDFIAKYNHYSLFENWLKLTNDAGLIIALFEKIANRNQDTNTETKPALKPQLMVNLFSQKQNITVQQYILNKIDDLETLEKLKKKSQLAEITQQLSEKITQLQFAIEQPILLRKKVNLVLAKLKALKDQYEYSVYLEKRQALSDEWQTLSDEFTCLESYELTEFNNKHSEILAQLDKLFIAKAEQHAQAEIARELEVKKQQARIHFDKTLVIIDQTLTTSIFENDVIDEQQYQTLFDKLTNEIIASSLTQEEQNSFIAKICQQQKKLQQLPEIAQSVSEATHLISKISQLALPTTIAEMNERLPTYQDWLSKWQLAEKSAAGTLPESIKNAADEIQSHWREALKPLQLAQKKEFSVTQKKLNDVKRLIASGKYNAAFGVHKKASNLFNALSEHQQKRLQKDFDSLNEKITELADWEHYIATPRKQQLLDEIKKIVETPFDNPNEQAEKVKQYRNTWNSLGHAEEDAEKELNAQFNQLCETAFAPCRLFFAEQEKLRAQHLNTRQSYLEQAKALALKVQSNNDENSELDYKALEIQLNQLVKLWQSAGQVDRNIYQEINTEFNTVLTPIKSAIKVFHANNKSLKQQLINKAEKLLAEEDIYAAVNQVKTLQNQWKDIGYAGPKIENKLWQSFRKINDAIFAKREQQNVEEKSQAIAKTAELEAGLASLGEQFSNSSDLKDLQDYEQAIQSLSREVSQHKPKLIVLEKKILAKEKSIAKQIAAAKLESEKQQWNLLFSILEQSTKNQQCFTEHNDYEQLSSFWQKKLKDLASKDQCVNRDEPTLELEILSGNPSPSELQQDRMTVQVSLMQTQMLSGAPIDLPAKFTDWLLAGKFEEQDLKLLNRIKPIFNS